MTKANLPICVAALYQFTPFDDHAALQQPLLDACLAQGVKGTLLLAHEGINGTIAGSDAGIEATLDYIRTLPGCAAIEVKISRALEMPFYRMKVRLKKEIVTMGEPDIDPVEGVGAYVAPDEWNALIEDPDTIVIDTRNDYEVAIGTFKGAIDPKTKSFREFPEWFQQHRAEFAKDGKQPKIAMFCTGGIRCEKATAYVKAQGLDDVYHLKGGILAYLEQVPEERSTWEGDCFVFDERVSVKHGLHLGDYALCRACRMPLTREECESDLYEEGVSCPYCHEERTDEQRRRYAERQRQTELAEQRGMTHIAAAADQELSHKADD
ncbi:rhodanese-related sulfurtransferase [Altericroceibacterium spongiae]|uniref:tRNA uridine(34) hydroxylase n=1 Tax=Altericroceibacterium spongiae TaxID=2320269 RepID=A0A420EC48_9SPHN|nr:rhodanese-related sulfurtransferase [Altericroceibacterium spongiae]RKF18258.1 rhodanese-related sulfurtransferase [Altericroceibacterium spongiae]